MLKTLITYYDTLHSNKEVQTHNFITTKWEGTFLAGWDPNAILGYLCLIKLALVITLRPGEQGYQNHRTISVSKILSPPLRSFYVTLVHSHLKYASEIWSPKSVTSIKRIEGVQRHATRLMLPHFRYNECLKRLNLLQLVYPREVKDLSTFHKQHFNSSLNSYFQFCSD